MYSDFDAADFVAHSAGRDFTLVKDLAREEPTAMPDMPIAVKHMVAVPATGKL